MIPFEINKLALYKINIEGGEEKKRVNFKFFVKIETKGIKTSSRKMKNINKAQSYFSFSVSNI